jgi:hypothetical protein
MQKEKFQEYLHNPASYKNADLAELEELTVQYPWFSSASLILLHCSNIQENRQFKQLLKKHSLFIPNRKVLHKLISSLPVAPLQIPEPGPVNASTTELHSRIEGIFDSEDMVMSGDNRLSEMHAPSVLEDDSLLDFSYSPKNIVMDIPVESHEPVAETGEIQVVMNPEENDTALTGLENERNFDHWISKMSGEPTTEDSPFKKYEIIESFINSEPGVIRADKETRLTGDISKTSAEENEGFITDTLAKIYVKQGLYNKAIYAYEKLCLKYPEKSIYFVTQIEEIRSLYLKK